LFAVVSMAAGSPALQQTADVGGGSTQA